MSQTCKFCGKSTQHDEACPTCQQLGETTLLTEVTEDETELLLKPIAQQEEGNPTTRMIEQPPSPQKNRIPLLLIALLILSVVAYGGYTLMNSPALENEQAEQDVELEKTAVQEIPKELQPYEHTSLLHPSLYQDMMLHIHGQKLILGQTSLKRQKPFWER
ncbi:hypothetical protein [Caldalkalibacillus mannanilyticus]|uniref:hypothetical protein n=1 Tax=Caldalkalibacillus mannanilyticus TaxID=1418 RepID=UPI000469F8EC|nr:hypothetical protein [Caldalkalibacillus mannanilyticus]